jgi:lauroyl/myristoyl acyltransferase
LTGYSLMGCIPSRFDHSVFEWLAKRRTRKGIAVDSKHASDTKRMAMLLGARASTPELHKIALDAARIRQEDEWANWRASHTTKWGVQTEVVGLEHARQAFEAGRGIVFWGMTFCGTLFPKIALASAGIELSQLSATDHGASLPLTKFGWRWVAPAYCLPENRYLKDRIYISDDNDASYLRAVGRCLKGNGCVWISAERRHAQNPLIAPLFGRQAEFPPGAPTLAMRYKATLIPAYTERIGTFHYRLTLAPPIEFDPGQSRKRALADAACRFSTLLEERVAANPAGWNWSSGWVRDLAAQSVGRD